MWCPAGPIQAGLSAAVAYEKRNPGAANAEEMRGGYENVADRGSHAGGPKDSLVDGVQIRLDEYIGLVDERVVVAVARHGVGDRARSSPRLLDGGREMLTVLLGEGEEAGAGCRDGRSARAPLSGGRDRRARRRTTLLSGIAGGRVDSRGDQSEEGESMIVNRETTAIVVDSTADLPEPSGERPEHHHGPSHGLFR